MTKKLLLATVLLLSATPAFAQEEVDRNAQMEMLKHNFMARKGMTEEGLQQSQQTDEKKRTQQQNKEYRAALLKALNERKLETQGVR